MQLDQTEKRYSSKLYKFFDLLYKLLVINIMTIIISLFIVTIFPAVVAAVATLKNNMKDTGVFKPYFKNFKTYLKKSFTLGLCLLLAYGAGIYATYFWATATTESETVKLIMQIAIVVIPVCLLIFTFMILHIPLLIITFEKLTNYQIFKTSLYVSIRYFLTTLIMLGAFITIVGLLIVCMFVPGMLAVWMIFGISMPLYLAVKVTLPIYYRFAKIDMEKINEQVEEDLQDEEL